VPASTVECARACASHFCTSCSHKSCNTSTASLHSRFAAVGEQPLALLLVLVQACVCGQCLTYCGGGLAGPSSTSARCVTLRAKKIPLADVVLGPPTLASRYTSTLPRATTRRREPSGLHFARSTLLSLPFAPHAAPSLGLLRRCTCMRTHVSTLSTATASELQGSRSPLATIGHLPHHRPLLPAIAHLGPQLNALERFLGRCWPCSAMLAEVVKHTRFS
jgi:hypothetical protein